MPVPEPFFDVSAYDVDKPRFDQSAVKALNPHRFEFEQLSGVLDVDVDAQWILGFRRYGKDEHWVRGHIPGSPLLPGVLMVEAAAQLGSWYCRHARPDDPGFWALAQVDKVRFRGAVRPGEVVFYACRMAKFRGRVMRLEFQAIRESGEIVAEGEITGMRTNGLTGG